MSFDGAVAMVTGGGKGVGRVIAGKLAARGAHVIVNCFHSPRAAADAEAEIRAAGGSAESLRGSVAREESVQRMFAEVEQRHGRLDVLVNNAAHDVMQPSHAVTERDWGRVFDTGVNGSRWCAQAAAPLLGRGPAGAIVNLSSIGAPLILPNYTPVGVAKAAIEALTRYQAAEYAPLGIRVNTASASLIDGPVAAAWPEHEVFVRAMRDAAPLGPGISTGYSMCADYWPLTDRQRPSPSRRESSASRESAASADRAAKVSVAASVTERQADDSRLVAVVGMGIAIPGASSAEEFWEVLHRRDPVFDEPGEHFDIDCFWARDRDAQDRMYVRRSGFLRGVGPQGGSANELATGDFLPLGAAWLRHALAQARRGVAITLQDRVAFVPTVTVDGCLHCEESAVAEQLAATAGEHATEVRAALARHLPHAVSDPSLVLPYQQVLRAMKGRLPGDRTEAHILDAACASSLYTVDAGAKRILSGRADIAFCGGMWMLTPRFNVEFSKLGGLSPNEDVRCFDRDADGVILSDGAALVALKSLQRARSDGDTVLGVLAGFGGASDGRGKAVYAPSRTGQERAIRRARSVQGITASRIEWIVAHATGTPTGDRVELGTLAAVAEGHRPLVTSNKALVGHTAAAAGVVSLIHGLLGLQHGSVPAQQRFITVPPDLADEASASLVPIADAPLPDQKGRAVGVSAFGFGGVNAHQLLVEVSPELSGCSIPPLLDDPFVVVGWSAHLPGEPDRDHIRRWLSNSGAHPWATGFADPYPPPAFQQVRMPPPVIEAIDRSQLMALTAVARLVEGVGEPWREMAERTGVVVGHAGFARRSGQAAVRVYRHLLDGALPEIRAVDGDAVADTIAAGVATVCRATPPIDENTAPGTLPNVIAGRVANRYDLHGPLPGGRRG
ncbi:SDR family oxidoreductase [Streptomyces niger]|uniref:SDR family oxidoreductase n=1 Tax=Streptomyces niger TaxID=66373 RepID=UPI00069C53AA|nr:SDR family oxidoreductase [Streptomyces niger]